ncbi:hypothetical protein GCM10027080_24660 [Pedococcus soli]
MELSADRGRGRRVGEPTHELALTRALGSSIGELFRPGPGRTTYIIFEPEVGRGRPDAIAVQISAFALGALRREGLRLPHLTASRAALASDETDGFGVTGAYGRQLRTRIRTAGWTERRATSVSNLIVDSLAVEAKMKDWRRALRQVAAFRPYAHRAALLVPQSLTARVDPVGLDVYQAGLLREDHGQVAWERSAPRREIDPAASAWLVELLVRGLDNGTAYSASELARPSRAPKKFSILEE